jgi:hypothetical protein
VPNEGDALAVERPIVIGRSSSSVIAERSRNTDAASSKVTPCFVTFARAVAASHS